MIKINVIGSLVTQRGGSKRRSVRPFLGSERIPEFESLFSFMKPRWAVVILLVAVSSCSSPSEVADPQVVRDPIIDMHLHAFEVVPGAMHPTGLRAPVTQQEYEERTLTLLEEYDVLAVASGPIELVRKWKAASPDRIIPGFFSAIRANTKWRWYGTLWWKEKYR